jgi:hypothetical protein
VSKSKDDSHLHEKETIKADEEDVKRRMVTPFPSPAAGPNPGRHQSGKGCSFFFSIGLLKDRLCERSGRTGITFQMTWRNSSSLVLVLVLLPPPPPVFSLLFLLFQWKNK